MNTRQQKYFGELQEVAREHNWIVVSDIYTHSNRKLTFQCPKGHIREIIPSDFKRKPGCAECSGRCPIVAERFFRSRINELGGEVIGEYKGANVKVECVCSNGHVCHPMPNSIRSGQGMCRKCAGNCKLQAGQNFITKITNLGGRVVGEYKGARVPVECICSNGHECRPLPNDIQQGVGMCNKCTGNCTKQAEQNFIDNVALLGGRIVGKYVSNRTKVECICSKGHKCFPTPGNLTAGQGMCSECSGNSSDAAERVFRETIAAAGGTVIGEYVNNSTLIECVCSKGHTCYPDPNHLQQRGSFCVMCDGKGPSYGERLLADVLDLLGLNYRCQQSHPSLKKLRFDLSFFDQGKQYFIEYDGEQHQREIPHFHRTPTAFYESRERDLVKNHIVRLTPSCVLIRIAHTWTKDRFVEHRDLIVEQLAAYIKQCMVSDEKIIADPAIYDWTDDVPAIETWNKYFVGSDKCIEREHEELEEDISEEEDIDVLSENFNELAI